MHIIFNAGDAGAELELDARLRSRDATLGDLVRAALGGAEPPATVVVDGRPVPSSTPAGDAACTRVRRWRCPIPDQRAEARLRGAMSGGTPALTGERGATLAGTTDARQGPPLHRLADIGAVVPDELRRASSRVRT